MSAIPLSVFWSQPTVPTLYLCAAHSESPICRERGGKKNTQPILGPGSALCGWALGDEPGAANAILTNAPH